MMHPGCWKLLLFKGLMCHRIQGQESGKKKTKSLRSQILVKVCSAFPKYRWALLSYPPWASGVWGRTLGNIMWQEALKNLLYNPVTMQSSTSCLYTHNPWQARCPSLELFWTVVRSPNRKRRQWCTFSKTELNFRFFWISFQREGCSLVSLLCLGTFFIGGHPQNFSNLYELITWF